MVNFSQLLAVRVESLNYLENMVFKADGSATMS